MGPKAGLAHDSQAQTSIPSRADQSDLKISRDLLLRSHQISSKDFKMIFFLEDVPEKKYDQDLGMILKSFFCTTSDFIISRDRNIFAEPCWQLKLFS